VNTDIEYLQQLEADLVEAAEREAEGRAHPAPATPGHRSSGSRWLKIVGVAAAFLAVAFVIGSLGFLGESSSDKFQQVGDAVASDGGGDGDEGGAGGAPAPSPTTPEPGEEEPGSHGDLSKIIRDGRIGIIVPNGSFEDAVGDLTVIAERHGGFILSSTTSADRSGTFVLRIPAARFDRARQQIRDLGLRVRFEQVKGEDVTAEFIDNRARLRILLDRKARLTGLADQADTTEEILLLGRQIDDVQLQIEEIQGQLRFLRDQVAESTLRVSIKEKSAPTPVAVAVVDQPSLGSSFDLAVQGFLRILGAVIVGLGYLIPIAVLGLLICSGFGSRAGVARAA
jgi:hypothetical protein